MTRSTCFKTLAAILCFTVIAALSVFAEKTRVSRADEIEITPVTDVYGLLSMADEPSGNYRLDADIDMDGVNWIPFEFSGTFDGNGHTLLNLTVNGTGEEKRTTYDGNHKAYETAFAGLFSVLSGTVENLNLLNERISIDVSDSAFSGGIAGYGENGTVRNCKVAGIHELKADAKMFGIGGIMGYGFGSIENCAVDITLICVDKNAAERDEQFLGGILAGGYADIVSCNIDLQGYVSERGYAHNGGIVGIYIFFPRGTEHYGNVTENTVNGTIHFFEDNTDRRAYCNSLIGEIMNWNFRFSGNKYGETTVNSTDRSIRDEIKAYDRELYPETCEAPEYTVTRGEAEPGAFGYTEYVCKGCGYTFRDNYRIYKEPLPTPTYTPTPEPTKTPVPTATPAPAESPAVTPEAAVTGVHSLTDKDIPPPVKTEKEEKTGEISDIEPDSSEVTIRVISICISVVLLVALLSAIALNYPGKQEKHNREGKRD